MNENDWLKSLTDQQKTRVYTAMWRISELAGDAGEIMKKHASSGDTILGPAGFDEMLNYYVTSHFLRCLGNGATPSAAMEECWRYSRQHIASHNRRFKNGQNGARWQGHGDDSISRAFRLILDAVPELDIKWPIQDPQLSAPYKEED